METSGWIQLTTFLIVLALITKPMGLYLAQVLDPNGRTWLDPVLRPLERLTYRLTGVQADKEMNWRQYAFALLGFSAISLLVTYAIERLQAAVASTVLHGACDVAAVRYLLTEAPLHKPRPDPIDVGTLARYDRPMPDLGDYDTLLSGPCAGTA